MFSRVLIFCAAIRYFDCPVSRHRMISTLPDCMLSRLLKLWLMLPAESTNRSAQALMYARYRGSWVRW